MKFYALLALTIAFTSVSLASGDHQRADRPEPKARETKTKETPTERQMRQIDPGIKNCPGQVIKDTYKGFKAGGIGGAIIGGMLSTCPADKPKPEPSRPERSKPEPSKPDKPHREPSPRGHKGD